MFEVDVKVPEAILKVPLIVKLLELPAVDVPLEVRLLKVRVVPELVIVQPAQVIVPELEVKTLVELFVRVPAIEKLELPVAVDAEAMARLKNVGAEPEVAIEAPLFKVMVPADGTKAAVVVRTPVTVAVVDAVMAALIFNAEYVVLFILCPEFVYSTVNPVRVLVVKLYWE